MEEHFNVFKRIILSSKIFSKLGFKCVKDNLSSNPNEADIKFVNTKQREIHIHFDKSSHISFWIKRDVSNWSEEEKEMLNFDPYGEMTSFMLSDYIRETSYTNPYIESYHFQKDTYDLPEFEERVKELIKFLELIFEDQPLKNILLGNEWRIITSIMYYYKG